MSNASPAAPSDSPVSTTPGETLPARRPAFPPLPHTRPQLFQHRLHGAYKWDAGEGHRHGDVERIGDLISNFASHSPNTVTENSEARSDCYRRRQRKRQVHWRLIQQRAARKTIAGQIQAISRPKTPQQKSRPQTPTAASPEQPPPAGWEDHIPVLRPTHGASCITSALSGNNKIRQTNSRLVPRPAGKTRQHALTTQRTLLYAPPPQLSSSRRWRSGFHHFAARSQTYLPRGTAWSVGIYPSEYPSLWVVYPIVVQFEYNSLRL